MWPFTAPPTPPTHPPPRDSLRTHTYTVFLSVSLSPVVFILFVCGVFCSFSCHSQGNEDEKEGGGSIYIGTVNNRERWARWETVILQIPQQNQWGSEILLSPLQELHGKHQRNERISKKSGIGQGQGDTLYHSGFLKCPLRAPPPPPPLKQFRLLLYQSCRSSDIKGISVLSHNDCG